MSAIMNIHYIILAYILLVKQAAQGAVASHKNTHQKDVSEYCRRRVLPSVFLGRHVLDANSQILHFSQLELPYSCSVSVRAESGSNIILVIQLVSEYSQISSCTEDNHQLLVYEIGETFGGYWGPLPDSIMRQEAKNFTQLYTIQATKQATTIDNSSDYKSDEEESEEATITSTQKTKMITTGDYIEVEMPLVNISGNFMLDGIRAERVDDLLKVLNDVTPRKGFKYDTKMLPLLQFSILTQNEGIYLTTEKSHVSVYQPGFYTPDSRLIFRTINKRRQFSNKRRIFTKRKHIFKTMFTKMISGAETWDRKKSPRRRNDSSVLFSGQFLGRTTKPREIIEEIIKSLRHTTYDFETTSILNQELLDSHQNFSVYLNPETLILNNKKLQKNKNNISVNFVNRTMNIKNNQSLYNFSALREFITNSSTLKTIKHHINEAKTTFIRTGESQLTGTLRKIYEETLLSNQQHKTSDSSYSNTTNDNVKKETFSDLITHSIEHTENSQLVTGSMVNHESWENVVKVAPVMAVLLNQTLPRTFFTTANRFEKKKKKTTDKDESTNKRSQLKNREKRYLQPLEIKNAVPQVLTTAKNPFNTYVKRQENFENVEDISHLVELKDDEVHGRVALRYMRNYVGSTLFNICDYTDPKVRQVYLFNTSRIVISISNFTMEKMTLVITPARVLKSKETNCPTAYLECQISGARVCIDSMTACDGVPNCGTYDIYDEDRLLCGMVSNIRHNVYLAACTFLAVLLTLLYIVHYWLKRCVPRVSEAFFVYTDRSENILNLETIMQSPHEEDNVSKMVYDGRFLYDEVLDIENEEQVKENLFKKLWKICLVCSLNRYSRDKDLDDDNISQDSISPHPPPKRLFSFAELELSKITSKRAIDAYVQTGNSIEQANLIEMNTQNPDNKLISNSIEYHKHRKEMEELSILKFLKESKSESMQYFPVNESFNSLEKHNKKILYNTGVDEERELLSTVYESQGPSSSKHDHQKILTNADVHSESIEPSLRKRLRFDEEATTIPSVHADDESLEEEGNNSKTQVILGTEKLRCSEVVDNTEEQTNGSGREFIRFWTGAKSTKSKKKKKRVALH